MSSSTQGHPLSLPERPRVIYAGEPKDYTLWDNHKETLRLLYLTQNQALKEVKRQMEADHGFPILPLKQYETVLLKHFGFSKKISRSDWGPIGYHVEKRVLAGKASHVYLGAKLWPASTVEREVRRYNKKAQIRSRIRQSLSPQLPRNITIRTPSPQPRHLATIPGDHARNTSVMPSDGVALLACTSESAAPLDISQTTDLNTRVELINAIRLRSPFTSFVSLIQNLMTPATNTSHRPPATTTDLWNNENKSRYSSFAISDDSLLAPLTSTGQSESRPSGHLDSQGLSPLRHQLQAVHIGGALTLDLLLQCCFMLSNRCELEAPLLKELLDCVGVSAEISVLQSFFSIKSHTVMAVWEALMKSAINTKREDVFEVLIDVSISIGRSQWIMQNHQDILNFAIKDGAISVVERLLDLGISPDPLIVEDWTTPLEIAVLCFRYDIVNLFLGRGADVNRQLTSVPYYRTSMFPPIFKLFTGTNDEEIKTIQGPSPQHARLRCLCLLLSAGAKVDVKDHGACPTRPGRRHASEKKVWIQSLGWTHYGKPIWFTDAVWNEVDDDGEVTSILLQHSVRMREHITMFGIATEARVGLENLHKYLENRPFPPDDHDRIALLEITLSRAAAYGRLKVVNCLLQFGVDPNVGTLWGLHNYSVCLSWGPVESALKRRHYDVVRTLKAYGAKVESERIIEEALWSHNHDLLRLWEISDDEIHAHGEEMLLLFLKYADKTNYQVCATMCDFLWSKGVTRDTKGCHGHDPLHHAIYHGCCLEMCKFLIRRGYEVHSIPRSGGRIYSPTQEKWTNLPPSTMLQDASATRWGNPSQQETKLEDMQEYIDFLLENGACVDSPYHNETLLEAALGVYPMLGATPRYMCLTGSSADLRLSLFEKLLAMGANVDVYPGNDVPGDGRSVIGSLLWLEADNTIIFRVLDATRDVDQHGAPLIMALWQGRVDVVQYLLSRGVKTNHRLHGRLTVLHAVVLSTAAKSIPLALVEHLISLGAEVNGPAGPKAGMETPLQVAAMKGNINLACLFIKHGADVNMLDPSKRPAKTKRRRSSEHYLPKRALDCAAQTGRLDMVQLLRDAGGISGDPGKTGVDGAIRCAEDFHHYSISDFLRSSIKHAST